MRATIGNPGYNEITADLKRRLQRAVDSEDFESAADLRDEIRALEVEYVE